MHKKMKQDNQKFKLNKKKYNKEYFLKNKNEILAQQKQYRLENKDKIKQRRLKDREKRNELQRQYRQDNKLKINKYFRNKRKIDSNYKITCNLRRRVLSALRGQTKSKSTIKLLGCSLDFLWDFLEKKFTKGMTKKNYGLWHLDHVKPCASFDLTDPKQQKECFHYTNLQPLWAADNYKKGAKYETINA